MTMPPSGQWPPPPQGPPPQYWGSPPPNRGGKTKWVLGGLGVLCVVVVTAVATLLVTRSNAGSVSMRTPSPETPSAGLEFASRDDRDPAGIVLEDPTCESWYTVADSYAQAAKNGWDQRDPATPATAWTTDQRKQYEAFAAAVEKLADRSDALAKKTPHRVMRELLQQFSAYNRAYAGSVPTYQQNDDHLVRAAIGASSALTAICNAIHYGSAGARSPLIASAAPTMKPVGDPVSAPAEPFLSANIDACPDWLRTVKQFDADTSDWRSVDPNIAITEMDPNQRQILASVTPVMNTFATRIQLIGRKTDNPTFTDFATLSAQYLRAYSASLVTYTPADDYLQVAAGTAGGIITEACRYVGGR